MPAESFVERLCRAPMAAAVFAAMSRRRELARPPPIGAPHPVAETLTAQLADELDAIDVVLGAGGSQRVGRFRFFLEGQRWEWSDAVARLYGPRSSAAHHRVVAEPQASR